MLYEVITVVRGKPDQPPLDRPTEDARLQRRGEHVGEKGQDVKLHLDPGQVPRGSYNFV